MDLIESVVNKGEINVDTSYMLTEPRSAGTGLRYGRLLKKYLAVFEFHGGLEGAMPEPFGIPFLQKYIRRLMADEVGFCTPQSLLYAIEHFAGVFGFNSPGLLPTVVSLCASYYSKVKEPLGGDPTQRAIRLTYVLGFKCRNPGFDGVRGQLAPAQKVDLTGTHTGRIGRHA